MADLLTLPDEMLVMILNYCTSLDLIEVSQVCKKLNDITCDRNIVRILNFHFQTNIKQNVIKSFLSLRPRAENVTTIDLTSCYWLTSSFILNLVSRLRCVENVLVADTALRSNHLKQLLQTLSRVKRLSWTWQRGMDAEGIEEALQRFEFLFLCLREIKFMNDIVKWVNKCVKLQELWINNIDAHSFMKCNNSIQLEHLEKIFLYPCFSWPMIRTQAKPKKIWRSHPSISDLANEQLLRIESLFTSHWREITYVVELGNKKIERLGCREPFGSSIGEVLAALKLLKALHIVMPDDVQSQEILSSSLDTSSSLLEVLSLDAKNKVQELSTRFCEVAACCPKLKQICLPIQAIVCLAKDNFASSSFKGIQPSTSRVSRVSQGLTCDAETPFKKMVKSTPLVKICEIGINRGNSPGPKIPNGLKWDFQSLSAISQWECLTSLTLANLPISHGKFLHDIFISCRKLQSIKIVDLGHEAICVYANDLYLALPHCSALEDFHWTQNYVGSTMKLWMSLQRIPSLKRVALCLQGESNVNEQDVFRTMEQCPLLFFLHAATCSTQVRNRLIKNNIISRWSSTRPHLCVWFGTPGEYLDAAESCPTVHAGEMLQEFSCIKEAPVPGSRFLSFGKRFWAQHM